MLTFLKILSERERERGRSIEKDLRKREAVEKMLR